MATRTISSTKPPEPPRRGVIVTISAGDDPEPRTALIRLLDALYDACRTEADVVAERFMLGDLDEEHADDATADAWLPFRLALDEARITNAEYLAGRSARELRALETMSARSVQAHELRATYTRLRAWSDTLAAARLIFDEATAAGYDGPRTHNGVAEWLAARLADVERELGVTGAHHA